MMMNDFFNNSGDNGWILGIIYSLAGYLAGSVSFARLINYSITRTTRIEGWSEPVPHSDEVFESDLVSATLIAKKLGPRYGCLTSLLDMLKVIVPTVLVKLLFTMQPWFLLTAIFGIIGHNYPVWYRFKGGRGESPILGALLVINWFGIFLVNAAGTILGFITGSVLVMRWSGYILMIFWYWIYFRDWRYVAFMILANLFFWLSMRRDLARFLELKRVKGLTFTEEDVSEFIFMGKKPGRLLDRYSLYSVFKKLGSGK
jgi:acyl phosphate:glycerol-3-phosphate acyltransferase